MEGVAFSSEDAETPDFVGECGAGYKVGLELTRWLNFNQTADTVKRERMRKQLLKVIGCNGYPRPNNIAYAVIIPRWKGQIVKTDIQCFCDEFHAAVQQIDTTWKTIRGKHWKPLPPESRFNYETQQHDLELYPTLCKYISSIWFAEPDKSNSAYIEKSWVSVIPDGGLYEPSESIQALRDTVERKLQHYSSGSAKVLLDKQNLCKLFLLVYADPELFTSNTSYQTSSQMMKSPTEGLADAARVATDGLKKLPRIFDGVFLYYSVWNAQWLAQIWPTFQPFEDASYATSEEANDSTSLSH